MFDRVLNTPISKVSKHDCKHVKNILGTGRVLFTTLSWKVYTKIQNQWDSLTDGILFFISVCSLSRTKEGKPTFWRWILYVCLLFRLWLRIYLHVFKISLYKTTNPKVLTLRKSLLRIFQTNVRGISLKGCDTISCILRVLLYKYRILLTICYFQKLQLLVAKKLLLWTIFCCIVLLYLWVTNCVSDF